MSNKDTLSTNFYVLTAIHENYSTKMIAQVLCATVLFGIDELLQTMMG